MTIDFGRDPVADEVVRVLELLTGGEPGHLESKHVDLKEEAGRRDRGGTLGPSQRENDVAAQQLAGESACMANTVGGGALIVGVRDDGTLVGTEMDAEWLRGRIYDLTQRLLTVDVREVTIRATRLLVIRTPQAIEPIRWKNRITWRVGDRCVEVDAASWHARRMTHERYDWSALSSHIEPRMARTQSLELARDYLRASEVQSSLDLAAATDPELLRRLNAVTADGYLTNAGALVFVGRGDAALDYMRRAYHGGDSQVRIRQTGRSLLEEIAAVERSIAAYNGVRHVQRGFVMAQIPDLPPRAAREAIVNGVAHRDWAGPAPTVIEHIGRSLVVSSPGGFIGGVTPENIITHPSQARNKALAELLAALRLAEREGIGVDRMVQDMVSVGYPAPAISEIPGPYVRTALVGTSLDIGWIRFLGRIEPSATRLDLTVLLLLRRLVTHWWVDVSTAAPILQLGADETAGALAALSELTIDGRAAIEPVSGVPAREPQAWRISQQARSALASEDAAAGTTRTPPGRSDIALDWAQARGRVSSTELASIVGAQPPNVGPVLKRLEDEGLLRPGRETRRGAGFFYTPAPDGVDESFRTSRKAT